MARCSGLVLSAVVVGLFVLAFSSEASAYLDPGTGSMIFQLLICGLAGLALAIKLFWRQIIGMFGGKKAVDVDDDDEDEEVEE